MLLSKSLQKGYILPFLAKKKKRTIVYADFERNTLGILAFCTAQFSATNLKKGYILPFF